MFAFDGKVFDNDLMVYLPTPHYKTPPEGGQLKILPFTSFCTRPQDTEMDTTDNETRKAMTARLYEIYQRNYHAMKNYKKNAKKQYNL